MRNKVTIGTIVMSNLRQRRSQNRVLATGVSLAVFFLAVCIFGTSCLFAGVQRQTQDQYGEADYCFYNSEKLDIPALFPEGFRMTETDQELLFACVGEGENANASFAAARYDEAAVSLLHARLAEGRWPEKAGEIAVEPSALWRMRLKANVGDTLTFTIVGWDGESLMAATEQRAFTVTGLLVNQNADRVITDSPLLGARAQAWVSAEEPLMTGSRPVVNTFVQAEGWRSRWILLLDTAKPAQSQMSRGWYEQGLFNSERTFTRLNTDILDFLFMNTGAFLGIAALFLALVTAAMAGVAAAVASNADKRRAQAGMLRAIGATQTQLARILRHETLGVCLLTLPIGVGGALLALWLAHRLMPQSVPFWVPWPLIAAVTACSALFLAAATGRPVRKAANVSPMQALRDVEMLRRQREAKVKSRKRFRPASLLAARNLSFHRGRAVVIIVLIVAGTFLVSVAGFVGGQMVYAYASKLPEDYYIQPGWGVATDFGNWSFGAGVYTRLDKQDLWDVPGVASVTSEQEGVVCILLDEPGAYVTGDGWDPECTYFFADGPAYARYLQSQGSKEYDEALAGEWPEHRNYRRFREQYGIDREALQAKIYAVDASVIAGMGDIYDGRIDIDAINAGREVVVVAPRNYFEYMEFTMDASMRLTSYGSRKVQSGELMTEAYHATGMPEEKIIHENDTFFAGDAIDLCWIMSYDGYDYATETYPARYTRVDASPTIGAVAAHLSFGYSPSGFAVVTTEQGLAAMGMDAGYTEFRVTLAGEPDEAARKEITNELRAVAGRVGNGSLVDYHEAAKQDRAMYRLIFSAVAVVLALLFAFTAALINSSVSGRIRSEERQIGTMRAVGADRRAIAASYTRQLLRLLCTGGAIGWGGYLLLRAVSSSMGAVGIRMRLRMMAASLAGWQTFTPLFFLILLFGVCALSVRARLRPIFKKPVVENIRIL